MKKPLLLIDVDGVISLFGFDPARPPDGTFRFVDGIAHFLSAAAGKLLVELCEWFEPAWCTGWEEKANEYLPEALGLPGPWPHLELGALEPSDGQHWKLPAIDLYAGESRALAWIDDGLDDRCRSWAASRPGPTLLVGTDPAVGLTNEQASGLARWAQALAASENTGGSRDATLDHVAPASVDPKTSPDVAPK
jgi:hypothetical protein